MRTLRFLLSTAIPLALAGLYAASQIAWFAGPQAATEYARSVDTPAMITAAIAVAAIALVLGLKTDGDLKAIYEYLSSIPSLPGPGSRDP